MITRWRELNRTFSMLDELQRRMYPLLAEFEPNRLSRVSDPTQEIWPLVNLYDAGDALVLCAQVPGISEKDIKITGNSDVITISSERKNEVPPGFSVHRQERSSIKFSRSLAVPCKVDLEKTTATVKDGILTVNLAKAPEAKPRQIKVKAL